MRESEKEIFYFAGRAGRAAHQSPENGDYDQIPD